MAIVSLGSMCLSTTLLHVYLNSFLWTAAFEQMNEKTLSAFPIFGGLGFLWGKFGMKQWLSQLYDISPLMRNNSMIGGLVASTVGLIYVLLTIPSPSLQTYAAYTLWPTYVGLIIGAVAARFFEVCMRISYLIWCI